MPARSRSFMRLGVAFAVSGAFIALLLARAEGGELLDAVRRVDALWLLLSAPVYTVALWLRAERWRRILRPVAQLRSRDATSLVVIGYGANNVLPARAGEVVRAVLLQRRTGGSRLTALGTIVVERVFDGLVLVAFLALTLPFAARGSTALLMLAAVAGVGFVLATLVLAALALRPIAAASWLSGLSRLAPLAVQARLRVWLESFLIGLALLRGAHAWAAVVSLTAASWGLEASAYWLVGRGFGLGVEPWAYLAAAGAANIAITAPSAAGGVGPFEFFAREVLVVFGAGVSAATAFAIALHALLLVPVVLAALVLLWREEIPLRELLGRRAARAGSPAAGDLAAGGGHADGLDPGAAEARYARAEEQP